jgi:hypothetical protein
MSYGINPLIGHNSQEIKRENFKFKWVSIFAVETYLYPKDFSPQHISQNLVIKLFEGMVFVDESFSQINFEWTVPL